jgi:hypothetical protein
MRRGTTPWLFVRLAFPSGSKIAIEYAPDEEISKPITLLVSVGNRSPQPAFYAIVRLGIGENDGLVLRSNGELERVGVEDQQNWLERRLICPPELPIFKETALRLFNSRSLTFAWPSHLLGGEHIIRLTTSVQTPGYAATERWVIHQRGGSFELLEPGHPWTR